VLEAVVQVVAVVTSDRAPAQVGDASHDEAPALDAQRYTRPRLIVGRLPRYWQLLRGRLAAQGTLARAHVDLLTIGTIATTADISGRDAPGSCRPGRVLGPKILRNRTVTEKNEPLAVIGNCGTEWHCENASACAIYDGARTRGSSGNP
jgi:hypothetical protein